MSFITTESGVCLSETGACDGAFEEKCEENYYVKSGKHITFVNVCNQPVEITGLFNSDPDRFTLMNTGLSGVSIYDSTHPLANLPQTIQPYETYRINTFFHPKGEDFETANFGTLASPTGDQFGAIIDVRPGDINFPNCENFFTLSGEFLCRECNVDLKTGLGEFFQTLSSADMPAPDPPPLPSSSENVYFIQGTLTNFAWGPTQLLQQMALHGSGNKQTSENYRTHWAAIAQHIVDRRATANTYFDGTTADNVAEEFQAMAINEATPIQPNFGADNAGDFEGAIGIAKAANQISWNNNWAGATYKTMTREGSPLAWNMISETMNLLVSGNVNGAAIELYGTIFEDNGEGFANIDLAANPFDLDNLVDLGVSEVNGVGPFSNLEINMQGSGDISINYGGNASLNITASAGTNRRVLSMGFRDGNDQLYTRSQNPSIANPRGCATAGSTGLSWTFQTNPIMFWNDIGNNAETPYYVTDIVPWSRGNYDVFLNNTLIYNAGVAQAPPANWALNGFSNDILGGEGQISLDLNYSGPVDSPQFKINFVRAG